jgi:predicted ATPase
LDLGKPGLQTILADAAFLDRLTAIVFEILREEIVAAVNALEVSRRQGARMFELRAATALARLWGDQGRRVDARNVLAPVYSWFTEGFDTIDLKTAKALLAELGE